MSNFINQKVLAILKVKNRQSTFSKPAPEASPVLTLGITSKGQVRTKLCPARPQLVVTFLKLIYGVTKNPKYTHTQSYYSTQHFKAYTIYNQHLAKSHWESWMQSFEDFHFWYWPLKHYCLSMEFSWMKRQEASRVVSWKNAINPKVCNLLTLTINVLDHHLNHHSFLVWVFIFCR